MDPLVDTDDELESKTSLLGAEDMEDPVEQNLLYSKSNVNWYPSNSVFQELISKQQDQRSQEKEQTTSNSSLSTKCDY